MCHASLKMALLLHKEGLVKTTVPITVPIFSLDPGTKIMQVGKKNKIRTYKSEIPNMGTIRGLIDLQLLINYIGTIHK